MGEVAGMCKGRARLMDRGKNNRECENDVMMS